MPRLFPTISAIVPALPAATFTHAGLHVGLTSRIVTVDGKEIGLAATKYALLRLLVRHAGRGRHCGHAPGLGHGHRHAGGCPAGVHQKLGHLRAKKQRVGGKVGGWVG